MMDVTEETMEQIKECLKYKDPIGLKKLILEENFSDEGSYWELVTIIGECITQDNVETFPGFVDVCERCLNYIVNKGNTKEIILALLEHADSFGETVKFQTFLLLIKKTLLKLERKQQYSLELALETLSDCIKQLPLPQNLDLEGEENRAHDLDQDVSKINDMVAVFLDFLTVFVDQVSIENRASFRGENSQRQIDVLLKYLLQIIEHPLVYLDLSYINKEERPVKSNTRICIERVVECLLKLQPNFHTLIEDVLKKNERIKRRQAEGGGDMSEEDEPVSLLVPACISNLVHCEVLGYREYPCILSHHGLLEFNLPLIIELMQNAQSQVQIKGVALLENIAIKLDHFSLTYCDLDRNEYFRIIDALFDIMVHCSVRETRQMCVSLLPLFTQLFDLEARYQIFVKVFTTLKHSGAYGYCVQLLKNQIDEILNGSVQTRFFKNLPLKKLLLLITTLQDGAATDLLEHSDRIISVLNLIRYLALRDPPKTNFTGFWDYISEIENTFLKPLRTGLELSEAHYKVEIAGLEESKTATNENEDVEMSVSVSGFKLPKMPRGQKIEIMKQALNTFDMITGILVRVNELVEQQIKQ